MMKTNIIKMFNLPSYIKGKSFAEASKAIEKKFEGKTDKYSNDTKEVFMKRLSEAQEYTKQMENPQADPTQNKMFLGGAASGGGGMSGDKDPLGLLNTALDLGKTAFGDTGIQTNGSQDLTGIKANQGGMAVSGAFQGAKAGMQFGPIGAAIGGGLGLTAGLIGGNKRKNDIKKGSINNALFQNKNYDNSYALGGLTEPTESIEIKNAEKSRLPMKDSNKIIVDQIGDGSSENLNQAYANEQYVLARNNAFKEAFNTWRQGKTGNTRNDSFTQTSPQYIEFWNKTKAEYGKNNPRPVLKNEDYYNNELKKGGYTNDYGDGDLMSILDKTGLQSEGITSLNPFGTHIPNKESYHGTTPGLEESALNAIKNLKPIPTNKSSQSLPKANLDPLKRAAIEAGRLAPAAFNAYQLATLDKPEYEQLNRLDNRYVEDKFDEQSLINNINSNYNKDYVKESSGGSLGSYAANGAAAELNRTRAISEGFQRGESINRQENTTAQEFNLGVDRQNLNQANLENENNVRNEGNYDTQKSRLIAQVGNDIGNIGKEQTFKQMVKDSGLCYDTSGAYICGTDTRLSDEQVKEVKSETNQNAKGGMLDSNSMFTSYLEYLKKK